MLPSHITNINTYILQSIIIAPGHNFTTSCEKDFAHLFGIHELAGAEVALLGGADDGEDGHEGGNEVHAGHHGCLLVKIDG